MTMKPPKGLNEWLRDGERGISSEAIVSHLTGINILDGMWEGSDYPHDPSDFRRCRELLETVPYCRRKFHQMKTRSPIWAKLVKCWDELEKLYVEESPSGMCPKLYDRMKEIGC